MAPRTSAELRRAWTDFFVARQHTIVPVGQPHPDASQRAHVHQLGHDAVRPLLPGEEAVPYDPPRAVSVQRCVRAGGKHNDLDAIGRSPRHLSFFEMLGNFSFGDYFKAEAIAWAWEFVTEVLELDPDRLWVTVHESDDEAEELWADERRLPPRAHPAPGQGQLLGDGRHRAVRPVVRDLLGQRARARAPRAAPPTPRPRTATSRSGTWCSPSTCGAPTASSATCRQKNIDTGAGLERIMAVLAGSPSLYASDTLTALVGRGAVGHRAPPRASPTWATSRCGSWPTTPAP